jgi:NADH-quinone oxidoreductase subunit N
MFFSEPEPRTPQALLPAGPIAAIVGVAAIATVLLGIAPQPLFDLSTQAGQFLR